ncbi:hypothetical protein ATCVOR07043_296L [Acanthocystis turfacea Chlorella virus OR0704.3]|nr:hypothetical protein ATCVOR07043_296L [Acanthocystis turfacea Chlorella virus OR0704.3]
MSVSLNPFSENKAVHVGADAGGVGIQLPPRFAARQQKIASPESDFGDDDPAVKEFMRDIANKQKMKNDSDTESETGSEVSADYEGGGNIYSSASPSDSAGSGRGGYYEETPSAGFLSIADEKADILFRLEVLRKQGIDPRRFSARDDIREMRAELTRIKTHLELDRSLKFSRKALVGLSAALEFLNEKVDVLDLELDGFSDQMHQSVYSQKDYDSILEELYFKYRNKVQTPPEIRLLLTFGGAALTFHMSNVLTKKIKHTMEDDNGGDMMAGIMKMFGGGGGAGPQIKAPEPARPQMQMQPPPMPQMPQMQMQPPQMPQMQMQPPQMPQMQMQQPMTRKEMAPPSFSFPMNMMPHPQQTSNLKAQPADTMFATSRVSDDESERLSDVPSDLESPTPSDFPSPDSKVIELAPAKKPRGRPRKNQAAAAGRVIHI